MPTLATEMGEYLTSMEAALLWSSTDDKGQPLDANYGPDDLDPDDRDKLRRQAGAFFCTHHAILKRDPAGAGHDYWLTLVGHGAGYWDGDWAEHGDMLTEKIKADKEPSPYVGDDGRIYLW